MEEKIDLSETECTDGKECGPTLIKRGHPKEVWCCMYCGMPVPVKEAGET